MLQRTKCGVAHTSGVHGRACESCAESNECDGGHHHNEHPHLGVTWPFQPGLEGHQGDGVCQHCLHHHPYCGMHFELRPTYVLLVLGWCQMHHRFSSRHCTHHLGTQTFSERFQILSPAPCYKLGLNFHYVAKIPTSQISYNFYNAPNHPIRQFPPFWNDVPGQDSVEGAYLKLELQRPNLRFYFFSSMP